MFRNRSPRLSFIFQSIKLTAANFDDGEFARDEKTVQDDEAHDRRQFGEDDTARIPMLGNREGRLR